jgi:protein tyrosine phosphatase (PTP) superfamily phosphohydrolase (DUF442 family)
MKKIFTLLFLSLFIVSCSHYGKHPHSVENAQSVGTMKSLKRYGPMTFAGQPDLKTIKSLKSQGYEIVINLRGKNEFKKFNEEKAVRNQDMEYIQIPFFTKQKEISRTAISEIHKVVRDNHNKKIFIHCSSGNRAAAWLGAHLYLDHGVDLEKSISVAKDLGMTKPKMEKKLRKFLK